MKIALRSNANGRFVSADDSLTADNPVPPHTPPQVTVIVPSRVLQSNRDAVGAWEEFDLMVQAADGSWVPFELQPAPTPPVPHPPTVEPWTLCQAMPGQDLVQCVVSALNPPHTPEGAFECTKRVAWLLRASGAGLLLKPGGSNIVSWHGQYFAAARICYPDGHIYKLLTDVPTTNGPSWQDEGVVDASGYVAAMDPNS